MKNTVTGGAQNDDDFSVDDFFDFPNDDDDDDVFVEDELKAQRKRGVSIDDEDNTIQKNNDFSTADEGFGSLPTSELSVPMDNLEDLEWYSNLLYDSSTPYPAPTKKPIWSTGNRRHPVAPVKEEEPCFKTPLPVKIRSKRGRDRVSAWSFTDSSSSSSTTSSSSSSAPSSPPCAELLDDPVVRKLKKKRPSSVISSNTQTQTQKRRCSHCGVEKTPQWRAGPQGAKTLCNACGVRFKSGRLLPEYRPACSPTFSSELHSNSHRKVIEMRRKKETTDADETELNPSVQVVPRFFNKK